MPRVTEILAEKSPEVLSIGAAASVVDAAVLMNDHRIGALVVSDDGHVSGIFTERDLLKRVVAARRDPAKTPVAEVMTNDVVCATADTSIEEARSVMKKRRIRHLPVVDDAGKIVGMVSIGDLNAWELDGQERTIHLMHEYLHGRV